MLDSAGTGCLCESPNLGTPGACAAPSAESCEGLTPAKFYDAGAGECVAVAACAAPAVLNAGTNLCDCPASYAGTDGADAPGDCVAASVESCGGLTPAKFYDSAAGACVAVAACVAPAVLDAAANLCDCPAPYVGTDGAAAPGDCAVLVPSVENCGDLTPTQFYDSTADACIPFAACAAPAVRNTGTNLCDCPSPNIGTDGAAAPGDCAVIAVCAAPAVRNAGTNLCDCPSPNIGADGAAAPGDCAAPSAEVCGGLSPAKFYDDSGAGECVAVAECDAPAVLNAGTNLCDCPAPNVGADGAAAPGDCVVASVENCGGLTPAQFYLATPSACVPFADCQAGATLNRVANQCECAGAAVLDGAGTGCLCESPNLGTPGDCAAPSAESCGGLSPAKFYDAAAGACVAVADCQAEATLNRVANVCECAGAAVLDSAGTGCLCESPNLGTPGDCAAPGVGSCGGLTPAKFYDAAAGACVAVADCQAEATLNRVANVCECAGAAVLDSAGTGCLCESPNLGTPGDCAAPGVGSCGGLTPAKFYDSAAGACVAVADCQAPSVLDAGANLCDCPSPNIGTDGAVAPGDCAAPGVESCGGLIPSQFYSATLSACVPFVECAAPAVLNTGTNLCDCPSPNVGTDGAAAPGECVAASVESCGGLSPAKFYDAAAKACVAVADCLAPAVLDAGANLCDCPSPNIGTDGAVAPGDCAVPVPSVENCGGLIPPQFYSATLSACVPFADCQGGATLNAGVNRCDCPAGSAHRSKLCAPVSDDFGELSDELLCGAFGGTVRTATGGEAGGRVCSGMDANDTFCIMDAEEADSVLAFPCRGLFKHLWACNVKFNRPALNPFFCGEKCLRETEAVGSGCR